MHVSKTLQRHVKARPEVVWLSLALLLVAALLWLLCAATQPADVHPDLVISEFMASNTSTLPDADGDYVDWIEIRNRSATDVDLEYWYLTDDDNNLTRWRFPRTPVAAGGYLVVFASAKDRTLGAAELHTNFRLDRNGEYLALVEPDGETVAWEYAPEHDPALVTSAADVSYARLGNLLRRRQVMPRYRAQFRDVSYGLDDTLRERYYLAPSPGAANGTVAADQGPILSDVDHTPRLPVDQDSVMVTAKVESSSTPLAEVTLHYRIGFAEAIPVPMADDGAHGDGERADGVYGAVIPSDAHRAGEMVRYYVTAADELGRASRWPLSQDALDSPQYLGTMIADPGVSSMLPVLYWFVEDTTSAREIMGTRAALFLDGVLYDNVFVRSRGYSSRAGWPKKSFKFEFNPGYAFQFSPSATPVTEFNLNNTYSDKAYVRQPLAWEIYRDAGVPYVDCVAVRVQQNGAFHSLALLMEHSDEDYLARQGLDPNGALYKMFNGADSATIGVAKVTRQHEDHSDLQAMLDGVHLTGQARKDYLFDHLDVPQFVNYLAVTAIMHDVDCDRKNYFLYRDTEGTGEWMMLPWDKDLTFGRIFDGHVLNDGIWADDYPQSYPFSLARNEIISALYDTPAIREMYLRRLRTVMDAYLQPPGTSAGELYLERRIDQLVAQIRPDVTLDMARWPFDWGSQQTFSQAIEILKTDYLVARRAYLYEVLGPGGEAVIPPGQSATDAVAFGNDMDADPASGDQDEEYFTIVNRGPAAVDISGWMIAGDIRYTFRPGVVVPAGGTLYVSPSVVAFRDGATDPGGRSGRFVQGDYGGRLSNTAGVLRLYDRDGVLIDVKSF